jgi:Protein of unknown function (DUF3106)
MKRPALALLLTLGLMGNVYAQSWQEISPESRALLRPLRITWEELPQHQRQQWLARTPRLQQLNREQLANAHERMAEWASLSQKQRTQVQRKLENDDVNNANTRAKSWSSFINQK